MLRHWHGLLHILIIEIYSSKIMSLLLKLSSAIGDLSWPWLSCLGSLVYCFQTLLNYLALQYFDIERSWWRLRNVLCALNLISTFLLTVLSLGQCHCWWNISPRGYHTPSSLRYRHGLLDIYAQLVSASVQIWFIRHISIEIYSS